MLRNLWPKGLLVVSAIVAPLAWAQTKPAPARAATPQKPPIYLAQAAPAPAAPQPGAPTSQQKVVKYQQNTTVNFDETAIEGTIKNPFNSLISSRPENQTRGFIQLRYNWHDMMQISVSGLSQ